MLHYESLLLSTGYGRGHYGAARRESKLPKFYSYKFILNMYLKFNEEMVINI